MVESEFIVEEFPHQECLSDSSPSVDDNEFRFSAIKDILTFPAFLVSSVDLANLPFYFKCRKLGIIIRIIVIFLPFIQPISQNFAEIG